MSASARRSRLPLLPLVPATGRRTAEERRERSRWLRAWLMDPERVHPGADLPAQVERWPEDWRLAWEERAAIMEYCGELPREVAEREAERCVREEHARLAGAAQEGSP